MLYSEPSLFDCSHSDKTGEKFFHIAGPLCVGCVGFIIALATEQTAARYFSLCVLFFFYPTLIDQNLTFQSISRFLMAQSYAGFIVFYSWLSTSIPRPPAKRAVALAFINAFSQLGNISGSYVSIHTLPACSLLFTSSTFYITGTASHRTGANLTVNPTGSCSRTCYSE